MLAPIVCCNGLMFPSRIAVSMLDVSKPDRG
jgi:hypothetical protein